MTTIRLQKLKRIHLFEFEDLQWFPNWIRICMTRYIVAFHKILGTSQTLSGLLAKVLKSAEKPHIYDLCSGSGGPMQEVAEILKKDYGFTDLKISLSDLYPNPDAANKINKAGNAAVSYITTPVDATAVDKELKGVRTMICSLHHMKPEVARNILKDAKMPDNPFAFTKSATTQHLCSCGGLQCLLLS